MKIRKSIILILLLVFILGISGCANNDPISRTDFLMDTVMTVKIHGKQNKKVLDEVFARLEEIENKMSLTIESSEVSQINKNAGIKPTEVSPDTYFVIKEAKKFAEMSLGAYEPTIGPLADLWDIKSGERERDYVPSSKEIDKAKSLVNYEGLELLENNQVYLKEKNMKIDLGGIAKGYAADEARDILIKNGVMSGIIDLGGNIFAHGSKEKDISWSIGMQNPLELTGNYLGVLKVIDKSVVTSGDYERYFTYDKKRYHHILDSNTGYPAENELTGMSIVSDKSIDGDALSTTLFVLGLEKGMKLANSLEDVEAIFIAKDKTVYVPKSLIDNFTLREGLTNFNIKEY